MDPTLLKANRWPQLTALAQRAGPWGFAIIYLGWAYLFWIPVLRSETSVWAGTNLFLFLVGGASPLLAAVVLAWLLGGARGMTDLIRRLVDVRLVSLRWWLGIVVFWPVFHLTMAGAAVVLGVTSQPFDLVTGIVTEPGVLAFQLTLAFLFPAVEEIGLRGYYLDRLAERFSITVAALVNGATWAVWHSPFVLLPGYYAATTFDPELSWWMPMIIADTVLFVWVWERTERSIAAVLVFHAMMNLSGEFLGITADMYPFVVAGHLVAAGAVVVSWQGRSRHGRSTGGRATIDDQDRASPRPSAPTSRRVG